MQVAFKKHVKRGAAYTVDKGFASCKPWMALLGATCLHPPKKFRLSRKCARFWQFARAVAKKGRSYARVRIHAERMFGRTKEFNFFNEKIPLTGG